MRDVLTAPSPCLQDDVKYEVRRGRGRRDEGRDLEDRVFQASRGMEPRGFQPLGFTTAYRVRSDPCQTA